MNFIQAVILGILQGLTEFIPVSSSGHLVLTQHFFDLGESQNILFELFLHLGTLFAVFVFFHKTLWDLVVSVFSWGNTVKRETHRENRNLILYLIIATIATGVVYGLFGKLFKNVYDMPIVVAFLLLVTGCLVFVSDYFKERGIPASNMGFMRSIIIGLAQGIAILPGISRSGATISASLATGVKRKDAARFSFLLSIPAILGANASEIKAFAHLDKSQIISYLGGMVSSFIVGLLVIAFLIRLIEMGRLKYFAYYCWFIGFLCLTLLAFGL
ncbi:MAG: undecaprenyl-diphosphate phosphatase [Candidatus Cloacimonas sp.]|jgi:undecaprenyl-diphosphatase|nr:undecaprenyl-diphosphate phosphatase [Candidatus Cloacimonas sp.]